VRTAAEQQLAACSRSVERHVPVGNQLVTQGLASCYDRVKSDLAAQVERVAQRLASNPNPACQVLWRALEEKWAAYDADSVDIAGLADMPFNTDDDLAVVRLLHRYELAHAVAHNHGCRPR